MAVLLQITYQKKLGLPNFSSHSCSVSLTTEIADVSLAGQETEKLYHMLQDAVDQEIKQVGFMPDATTYGMNMPQTGNQRPQTNGYHHANGSNGSNGANGERWNCTDGQKGFILRLVNEQKLDKQEVDDLAHQLFRVGVKDCDKMQASQLIEELLEKTGKAKGQRRWVRPQASRS